MSRALTTSVLLACSAALLGCQDLPGLVPLAQDQHGVTSMATDGNHVYWTLHQGALRRVSVDGGEVETVVDDITNPDHVALDGGHVYWTMNEGVIARAPKAGGDVEQLAENEQDAVGLRVDDESLYFARGNGLVARIRKSDGDRLTLADDGGKISSLALSGPSLFWTRRDAPSGGDTASDAVRELPTGGGAPSTLSAAPRPDLLALNGAHACWTALDPDALANDPTSSAMQITRVALDGSDPRVVARNLVNVDALVADDTQIYFSTLEGDVSAISVDGGDGSSPTTFASGPFGKTSITLDPTSVYWAHANGDAIFALPKEMTVSR